MPEVNLIHANGKNIGIYSDEPSWLQNLEKIHLKNCKDDSFESGDQDALIQNKEVNKTNEFIEKSAETSKDEQRCLVIGETQLHIAITFNDVVSIKFLIEQKGFDVNQKCMNDKFEGGFNSKSSYKLIMNADYYGFAYYGEYPLAFAACFASKEIYDLLIDSGADPNMQGNSF